MQTQNKNDVLYGTLESNGPNKYCTVQGVTILHTYHTTVLPHCRTKKITRHIPIDIQMHTLPPPLAQFLSELRGLAVWLKMTNHIIKFYILMCYKELPSQQYCTVLHFLYYVYFSATIYLDIYWGLHTKREFPCILCKSFNPGKQTCHSHNLQLGNALFLSSHSYI